MFCGVSLVGMLVLFFMLPETKNKTLEEVEELFMSKEYKQKHRSSKKYESADNSAYEGDKL